MMMSLFSVFDPSSSSFVPNWTILLLTPIIIPSSNWIIFSRPLSLLKSLMSNINNEFKLLFAQSFLPGMTLFFISLMTIILLSNFIGLFPYIFTSTSHMTTSIPLALTLWMSFNLFGWLNNTKSMLAHLVPTNTPVFLMNFMVCIETISAIIRPLTLSIRLSANMIAGHLLMTLLGNLGSAIPNLLIIILLLTQISLLVLEMAVAIIQSYVFSILSTLYASEVN